MEREKGFESQISPGSSRTYETSDDDTQGSTRPPDASGCVPTSPDEDDDGEPPPALPATTPQLFITAGIIIADWAGRDRAERTKVEGILRRAIDQAAVLRGEAA